MSHQDHRISHGNAGLAQLFAPSGSDPLTVRSRRWFLQAGLSGMCGVSLADMLRLRAQAAGTTNAPSSQKSVIMFWLSGGPSHLDMWDPKPAAPSEIRGPFGSISTKLPGVQFGEHLPLQAAMADKMSIIRSVDCSASNHTPITMQAGNPLARRTDNGKDGAGYPSMGSVAAKFRGPNRPGLPAFVGLADSWVADVYGAANLGTEYEPVKGAELAGRFSMPQGIDGTRLQDRNELRRHFDRLRQGLDQHATMERVDRYTQQAYDMVVAGDVQRAFDVSQESAATREAHSPCLSPI